MELPCRVSGDELLRPGEMNRLRLRLRHLARGSDLTTVIVCAFDHRTRILPFIGCDMKIVPAGVRAIGSAMADAGFPRTRIVLQQWNPNFRPSQMRLDGRMPDLFMVSSMHLHSAECDRLIRDACRIEPSRRPLVVVGRAAGNLRAVEGLQRQSGRSLGRRRGGHRRRVRAVEPVGGPVFHEGQWRIAAVGVSAGTRRRGAGRGPGPGLQPPRKARRTDRGAGRYRNPAPLGRPRRACPIRSWAIGSWSRPAPDRRSARRRSRRIASADTRWSRASS